MSTLSLDPYNAYSFRCEPTGQFASYKVCLHILEAHDDRGLGDSFSDCNGCINAGSCPARAMANEELEQNRAIYFVESSLKAKHEAERNPVSHETVSRNVDKTSESYKRGFSGISAVKPKTRSAAPRKKSPEPEAIFDNPHAALVNAAVKKERQTKPNPGEPFIDYIRRLNKEKA